VIPLSGLFIESKKVITLSGLFIESNKVITLSGFHFASLLTESNKGLE
jgi:hypothetical protein